MMNDEQKSVIKDKLEQLHELMGESYVELLNAYLSDAPERMESMLRSLAQGDLEQLAHDAHSLKGSCSNMGASELAVLCEEVVGFTRDGGHVLLREKVAQVQQCYQDVHTLLQEELASCQ